MKFDFKLDDKTNVEIERSFWLGKTQVKVNGTQVERQKEGNYYPVKQGKGKTKQLKILGSGYDGVPRVYIDGEKLPVARKLFWYEFLVSCAPLVLVFMGGALGGLLGAIGTVACLNVVRREYSYALRLLLILAITLAAVALYIGLTYLSVYFAR